MKKTAKQPKGTRVPAVKKKTGKVESWAKEKGRILSLLGDLRKEVSKQQLEIDVLCEWLGRVSERVGNMEGRK